MAAAVTAAVAAEAEVTVNSIFTKIPFRLTVVLIWEPYEAYWVKPF